MHRIAVSLGDPLGIGPEVVARALTDRDLRSAASWVLIGDAASMRAALSREGLIACVADAPKQGSLMLEDVQSSLPRTQMPEPAAWAGEVSFRAVEQAIARVKDGSCDAIVTAPISKAAWALAGHTAFPGHTELLAHSFSSQHAAMMFHAPADASSRTPAGLHVILATVHIPISRVPTTLSTRRIVEVAQLGARELQRLGVHAPRIGLCGLNPHAGEGGLLGKEDQAVIAPAAKEIAALGFAVQGPLPADTIFAKALAWPDPTNAAPISTHLPPSHFDLVVAMYHDQGLAPLKMIAWERAVNTTVGLLWKEKPVIRTSPDHGTAFDIAGKGIANAGSMRAAMRYALGK
jgi:4-hydroxythreonine-4-phosphate dehydrogenase